MDDVFLSFRSDRRLQSRNAFWSRKIYRAITVPGLNLFNFYRESHGTNLPSRNLDVLIILDFETTFIRKNLSPSVSSVSNDGGHPSQ